MATDIPRADRYAEVVELRKQGLTYKETAARMGISLSYVRDLLYDPDGSKSAARKASYSGVCQRCGGPTDGSNGRALAPKLCWDCFVVKNTPNHGTYTRYDGGCRCEHIWESRRLITAYPATATTAVDAKSVPRRGGKTNGSDTTRSNGGSETGLRHEPKLRHT